MHAMPGWDWSRRAAAVREAEAAAERGEGVVAALHAAVERAWPPGFFEARERLHEGRATRADVDLLIDFLVADPVFFRSDQVEQSVLRFIKPAPLEAEQAERLRAVVVDAVERRHRPHFERYCSLARAVDAPALRERVRALAASQDAAVRRHAAWMTEALERRR